MTDIPHRYYVLSAFGTEGINNSVSHAEVLQRMSEIIHQGRMYGVTSYINNQDICMDFRNCFEFISSRMDRDRSTIISSIIESLNGQFGYSTVNERTVDSPIWISPLTSLLWFFDLDTVAQSRLYYEQARNTYDRDVLEEIIASTFFENKVSNREEIPI